jgi:thymidine kinase
MKRKARKRLNVDICEVCKKPSSEVGPIKYEKNPYMNVICGIEHYEWMCHNCFCDSAENI